MQAHSNNIVSMYLEPSSFLQPMATNLSGLPIDDNNHINIHAEHRRRPCFQGVSNSLTANEVQADNEIFENDLEIEEEQFVLHMENMNMKSDIKIESDLNNWNSNAEMQTCGNCEEGDEVRLEEWVEELMRDVSFLP